MSMPVGDLHTIREGAVERGNSRVESTRGVLRSKKNGDSGEIMWGYFFY